MGMVRGRILVIRGGAIGDFILTLPAIAALRRQFPEAHLEVLGYPHIAQLSTLGGLVDAVQPIEARDLAGFFARGGDLPPVMSAYFAQFHLILSYLYDPDLIFQTNVAQCSKAQFIAAPHRPDDKAAQHATVTFLKPLERLAIFDADSVPRLPIQRRPSTNNFIALHPGSGSEQKNWPEQNWTELIRRILDQTEFRLLLVGGEAEGERLERLFKRSASQRIELARNLPLLDLAARISTCRLFLGHDSGITHLAAALGLPTVVLWGPTVKEVWGPQGVSVTIVHEKGGLGAITVERVLTELLKAAPGFAA
jgi:heptosyltransferase-2